MHTEGGLVQRKKQQKSDAESLNTKKKETNCKHIHEEGIGMYMYARTLICMHMRRMSLCSKISASILVAFLLCCVFGLASSETAQDFIIRKYMLMNTYLDGHNNGGYREGGVGYPHLGSNDGSFWAGDGYNVLIDFQMHDDRDRDRDRYRNGGSVSASDDNGNNGVNTGLGPHNITVYTKHAFPRQAQAQACAHDVPTRIRIVGDALIDVTLSLSEKGAFMWEGSFMLPMTGSYQIEHEWNGIGPVGVNTGVRGTRTGTNDDDANCTRTRTRTQTDVSANGNVRNEKPHFDFKASEDTHPSSSTTASANDLFVKGAWIKADKVKIANANGLPTNTTSEYVWADPVQVLKGKEFTPLEGSQKSLILKESTVDDDNGFYSFGSLSNYELVCWIGSQSAQNMREAFLKLRGQLFPGQRPFKFHYYPATSLVTPAKEWKDNIRTGFRKCKHILVSLDEPDVALSQRDYMDQVEIFVKHLLNAFDEEHTFPALIWLFTVNESAVGTENCHDPIRKSTNHPCNDALTNLFTKNQDMFSDRVRLMDNTDISQPRKGQGLDEVMVAIALRTFIVVGKQVKVWRDAGMSGGIKGLTKNGVTTPNYPLEIYDWSQKL